MTSHSGCMTIQSAWKITFIRCLSIFMRILLLYFRYSDRIWIRALTSKWQCVSAMCPIFGKEEHIAWLVTELSNTRGIHVRSSEIILLDDDTDNINVAREFGHHAYSVFDDVTSQDLKQFILAIKKPVGKKRPPSVQPVRVEEKKPFVLASVKPRPNSQIRSIHRPVSNESEKIAESKNQSEVPKEEKQVIKCVLQN